MKTLITAVLILGLIFIAGCSGKNVVKTVVEKTYGVVVSVETVIAQSSTENFVTTVKLLETPIKVTKVALSYVETKVSDEKVKAAVVKAQAAVAKLEEVVAGVDPEQIDMVKTEVLNSVADIKAALVFVGEYVDAELGTVAVASADPQKGLEDAVSDLEKLLEGL